MQTGSSPRPGERPGPVAHPIMRQRWERLTFLHWPVDPGAAQRRLPQGLTVDTHDDSAWVALVLFRMEGIGPARGPAVPYFGSFFETNVRTYVRGPDGLPGIWFDSLDIDRAVPVMGARIAYGLPYMWAQMSIESAGDRVTYRARRRWPHLGRAFSLVTIRIGPAIASEDLGRLDLFLTARWRFYSVRRGRLLTTAVGHPPWPLHRAEAIEVADGLVTAAGYPPPRSVPRTLYSPGVAVVAGRPTRAG